MMRRKRTGGKYHAKKTVVDGITFDSNKESVRYIELRNLKMVGIIKEFTCQPSFVLQEGYKRKDGKRIRAIRYVADFEVVYPDGHTEIEDVKSVATVTPVYKIKKKMLEKIYPDINFKEVF